MEVFSTKYDGTGMGLATISGNPVRTYQRTPYGVIIGGPDGKAPSSRGFIESHVFDIFLPPNWYLSTYAAVRDSSMIYPTLPSKTAISSLPMRALPTFIRSVLKLLKAVKQGRRREL
jgi:hypothetical protein